MCDAHIMYVVVCVFDQYVCDQCLFLISMCVISVSENVCLQCSHAIQPAMYAAIHVMCVAHMI